jgi:hypothetical protein
MEQRQWIHKGISRGKPETLANEPTIIGDTAMRQQGAFWCTGCTGGILDLGNILGGDIG